MAAWAKTCIPCQLVKTGHPIHTPLKQKPLRKLRFSDLEIDVLSPHPESEGYRYLLTIL